MEGDSNALSCECHPTGRADLHGLELSRCAGSLVSHFQRSNPMARTAFGLICAAHRIVGNLSRNGSIRGRHQQVRASLTSPSMTVFPVFQSSRLPHYPLRGLLDLHSRYGLHDRQVPCRTLYTEGFNSFVTSAVPPIATGWSDSCRAGFAPAERQRLCTAH